MKRLTAIAIGLSALVTSATASAQQVNVETPFHSVGHSYYEQIGVRWGLRGNGWFFNSGGLAPVPFGGGDPNAAAHFGFGGQNGFFTITAGQGSDRSLVSSSPSVTIMNGGQGYFSDTTQYNFGADASVRRTPRSDPAVFIASLTPQATTMGAQGMLAIAMPYRGKRVRLSAYLKAKDVERSAAVQASRRGASNLGISVSIARCRRSTQHTGWRGRSSGSCRSCVRIRYWAVGS